MNSVLVQSGLDVGKLMQKKSPLKHNGDFTKRDVRFLQQWFIQMGHSTSLAWV